MSNFYCCILTFLNQIPYPQSLIVSLEFEIPLLECIYSCAGMHAYFFGVVNSVVHIGEVEPFTELNQTRYKLLKFLICSVEKRTNRKIPSPYNGVDHHTIPTFIDF